MGSSSQQTQSTTNTSPWSVQEPYLQQGFGAASSGLGQANANASNPNYAAPTGFTAGLTPQQLATYNSMSGYNSNAPGAMDNYGTGALNLGSNEANAAGTGLGNYNPFSTNNIQTAINGGNAYAAGLNIPAQVQAAMFPAVQTANEVTLPGMASAANPSGNANSSRTAIGEGLVQQGLAENAQNIGANLEAGAYNTGAGLAQNAATANNQQQLGALSTEGSLGQGQGALGTGALGQSVNTQGNVYGIQGQGGAGLQAGNQAGLTNQLQGYNFGQSSPFQALQNYWNIIGSGSWGGTSNTNSNTTYNPSLFSTIGGLMGAGGSLLGAGPSTAAGGAASGGSGLLGLLAMSDRRQKRDIEQVGELFDGTKVYRYRFNNHPQWHIGVMAQEVEEDRPESVFEHEGVKYVNYLTATDRAAHMRRQRQGYLGH